jgi:hypothetical protein
MTPEVRQEHMSKYSYESILRAVGQVLDAAEARGFAIHDDVDGLVVRTSTVHHESVLTLKFGLADLVELLDHQASAEMPPHSERRYNEGTLLEFLERRALVGSVL